MSPRLLGLVVAAPCAALLVAPAGAGALGLPNTFPRTIVITGDGQGARVSDFEVATRAVGHRMQVKVRLAATMINGRSKRFDLAVGPCTGGTITSPLCKPTATRRVTIATSNAAVTRTFLVRKPALNRDAVRVTLNAVGARPVWRPEFVGGGGGTAELLLNGHTWRWRPGSWWGVVARPPAGVTVEQTWFNSRRYEWRGASQTGQSVTVRAGYADLSTPRWTMVKTMPAGVPYQFRRTGSSPVLEARSAPRVLRYTATVAGGTLFTMSVPLPAWQPV